MVKRGVRLMYHDWQQHDSVNGASVRHAVRQGNISMAMINSNTTAHLFVGNRGVPYNDGTRVTCGKGFPR